MRWFKRLADVPGIDYHSVVPVERECLPGHDTRPLAHGGWPTPGGWAVSSPAWWWMMNYRGEVHTPSHVRQRIAEALELPGYLKDYASAIGMGIGALWALRAQAGWVPFEVERLCWLQVRLAEVASKGPEAQADPIDRVSASGAEILVDLYAREGYLREAIEAADRIVRVGQPYPQLDDLRARLSRVEAEHDR